MAVLSMIAFWSVSVDFLLDSRLNFKPSDAFLNAASWIEDSKAAIPPTNAPTPAPIGPSKAPAAAPAPAPDIVAPVVPPICSPTNVAARPAPTPIPVFLKRLARLALAVPGGSKTGTPFLVGACLGTDFFKSALNVFKAVLICPKFEASWPTVGATKSNMLNNSSLLILPSSIEETKLWIANVAVKAAPLKSDNPCCTCSWFWFLKVAVLLPKLKPPPWNLLTPPPLLNPKYFLVEAALTTNAPWGKVV